MTTYVSETKTICRPQEIAFNLLSDLTNLQKMGNVNLEGGEKAAEYLNDITFDVDSLCFSVTGIGRVGFRIVEREPFKTIKLETENSPIPASGWIQLVLASEDSCKMRITIKAELPMMIKMMLDGKLKEGINVIADAVANTLNNRQ